MICVSRHFEHFVEADHLQLDNKTIMRTYAARNLCAVIDSKFLMNGQIDKVRPSRFYHLSWTKSVRHPLTEQLAKTLIHALIISRIDYCNSYYEFSC